MHIIGSLHNLKIYEFIPPLPQKDICSYLTENCEDAEVYKGI